jgi:hypothetical protein
MKLVSTKEEQKGEKNQTQIVGYKWIPWAFSPPPPQNCKIFPIQNAELASVPMF